MAANVRIATFALAASLLLAAGCTASDKWQVPQDPGQLVVPSRTHLSLCVDSAGGRQTIDADVDFVQAALDQALVMADSIPPEYRVPTAELGCPPPLELDGTRLNAADRARPEALLDDPDLVSPYRLFVYLVPPEAFAASFGDASGMNYGTSQWLCSKQTATATPVHNTLAFRDDDTCDPVTTSIYVPDNTSAGDMAKMLQYSLGLTS